MEDINQVRQRNGKPVKRQGRKATGLQGERMNITPHGCQAASCSLSQKGTQ